MAEKKWKPCEHEYRVVNNNRFYYGYGYYCIKCLHEVDPKNRQEE